MKHWILAAATLLLINGVDAREHWGPPPLCPQPKADCCPKPCPKPCPPPCPPKPCKPKPCAEACPQPCPKPCPPDPCCPPVCFERGLPTTPCCTPTAYSESAAIDLRCGWDTFITANFIYWEAIQGGMDLAIPAQGTITGGILNPATLAHSATGRSVLEQDFDYKPGFQVGLGWSGMKDDWVLYAQYTWLHGTTKTSADAPSPGQDTVNGLALPQDGIWIPTSWFNGEDTNNVTQHVSSEWNYKIDYVDAQLSRPFYSGARFTVEPFFGLRGAWIRQSFELEAPNLPVSVGVTPGVRQAHYSSTSRAVGPRVGMNGNWLMCWGFRLQGNAAASLLFTGYDVDQSVDAPNVSTEVAFPTKMKIHDLNVLRPNMDLSLGLGWGSYFCCRRVYFDLAATYDFSIFWGQNMMRSLADLTSDTTSHRDGAPSDLFLQGLTVKTRFDF